MTQYTFNFNNFSIIYLFNEGGPGDVGGGAGNTDILISWIYKLTTNTTPQYGLASAVTLLISAIVIAVSLLVFKRLMRLKWTDLISSETIKVEWISNFDTINHRKEMLYTLAKFHVYIAIITI